MSIISNALLIGSMASQPAIAGGEDYEYAVPEKVMRCADKGEYNEEDVKALEVAARDIRWEQENMERRIHEIFDEHIGEQEMRRVLEAYESSDRRYSDNHRMLMVLNDINGKIGEELATVPEINFKERVEALDDTLRSVDRLKQTIESPQRRVKKRLPPNCDKLFEKAKENIKDYFDVKRMGLFDDELARAVGTAERDLNIAITPPAPVEEDKRQKREDKAKTKTKTDNRSRHDGPEWTSPDNQISMTPVSFVCLVGGVGLAAGMAGFSAGASMSRGR